VLCDLPRLGVAGVRVCPLLSAFCPQPSSPGRTRGAIQSGVNQPVTIQLPADCPPNIVDAPQLPDATNVQRLPGLLTFDTATSLADAAAFYKQQLPGLGWTLADGPNTTDAGVFLDFARGDQTLTVILAAGEGGTRVNVVVDSAQKVSVPDGGVGPMHAAWSTGSTE